MHGDENTETLDSYITCIIQVDTSLVYDKPQVLEVFENTPYKILLGTLCYRRFKTSGRNSQKNPN